MKVDLTITSPVLPPTPLKAVHSFVQSGIAGLGTFSVIRRSETVAKKAVVPGLLDLGGNVISS
jgi:hypothetical protein